MNKIYVPVTGPMETKRAIETAINLAKQFNLTVVVINVIDQESIAKLQRYKIFVEEESSFFTDNLKKDAEKYLHYAKKRGDAEGVMVQSVLLDGDPFLKISEYIRNDDSEGKWVCIAKKNQKDNGKDMFGSIEKKILNYTDFDFIVVGVVQNEDDTRFDY